MTGHEPEPYLCERVRAAIASEAHALGIEVTLGPSEAWLDGSVETDEQRARVEAVARTLLVDREIRNRLAVVPPSGPVGSERLP